MKSLFLLASTNIMLKLCGLNLDFEGLKKISISPKIIIAIQD